ncbi:MAG: hypothetical protein QRY72_00985 [Candidatus Rhabdochlamydia sp.]
MEKADQLELLSLQLFRKRCEKLNVNQTQFLKDKWNKVLAIAAQNGGYKNWGVHLLDLSSSEITRLEVVLEDTLQIIEEEGIDLMHLFKDKEFDLAGIKLLLDPHVKINASSINKEVTKALFVEYNPHLVAKHREIFQQVLDYLMHSLTDTTCHPLITETLVGNLIALLPYFDFEEGSTLFLIQNVLGEWKKICYEIDHIPLIEDKIIAYGLTPIDCEKAPSLLIFRGTPYPAAPGFLEALFSDFHPACSIGKDIFEAGREKLDLWMKGRGKINCFGMSLGGSLAYHMGMHYQELAQIYVYGAPGMVTENQQMKQVCGKIFFHYEDLVRLIGFHPDSISCQMYAVLTKEKKDLFITHTQPLGLGPLIVLKVYPRYENLKQSRYLFNIFKAVMSLPLFCILFPLRISLFGIRKIQKGDLFFKHLFLRRGE